MGASADLNMLRLLILIDLLSGGYGGGTMTSPRCKRTCSRLLLRGQPTGTAPSVLRLLGLLLSVMPRWPSPALELTSPTSLPGDRSLRCGRAPASCSWSPKGS